MDLAEKLRSARLSKKLSQKTLAGALGVSRTTLSAWESGKAVPSVIQLRRYQEIFGFKKGYFDSQKSVSIDLSALSSENLQKLSDFYEKLIKNQKNS
ncbi:MAG: helix-turn-helix transcriptional regulator [Clostridia bacterium]|nr:helix-turn-helix transcriptional regulator [Clostridia bacterium]